MTRPGTLMAAAVRRTERARGPVIAALLLWSSVAAATNGTHRFDHYAAYGLGVLVVGVIVVRARRRRAVEIARTAANERRLSGALWGSGDELWDWNILTGEVVRSNLLPSLPPPEPGGSRKVRFRAHPDDIDEVRDALQRVSDNETSEFEAVYRLPDTEGRWIWILDRGKVAERAADGKPLRVVGTLRNIDAIMRTEEHSALLASALEQSREGALIFDAGIELVFANHAAERYLSRPAQELRGARLTADAFRLRSTVGAASEIERFRAAIQSGHPIRGEFECELANGAFVPIEVGASPIRDAGGAITHWVVFFADVTFRKQAEDELRRLARFDSLTGLPNRSLFLDRLEQALAHARRNHSRAALLFIDLDHFKLVNDSLGHAAGDELLRAVAERLQSGTRETDTVARLGGDEFTVIVADPADDEAVATVAHKLIESLAQEFELAGQTMHVSPSIGIAMYPDDGADGNELLMHSDIAMYHAKSEGRNNFQFFRPELNARVRERIALEEKLRAALAAGSLELYYQPKVCTDSARLVGLEALARWRDPEQGMIPPSRFIPVAEESGLIIELGRWVLQRACAQTADWIARGLDPGSVAVNLSARQFRDRGLITDVRGMLEAHGLPAERLELEITESTLVGDMDYAIQMLQGLRALGVRLALDDFGTGYSSLSYLRRFPIHTLKLDRSFLREVPDNAEDSRLVRSIINLAHDLGVRVTAEGIEMQAQWDYLRECRCEELQGYLIAGPLPVAEVEKLLPPLA